jgi:transcriptional regulator with XRE-family HTH domain
MTIKSDVRQHYADKIRDTRLYLGMSQRAFARAVGMGYRSIQRYEAGTHEPPKPLLIAVDFMSRYGVDHMADFGVTATNLREGAEEDE